MDKEEIIKLWKKLNVDHAIFSFYCGGDSMGDTSLNFYNEKGEKIENEELSKLIESEIYHNVEFYENSDGHYIGETGEVEIILNDEKDGFVYNKSSRSEYCENFEKNIQISLEKEEIEFIEKNITKILGNKFEWEINYKKDLILSEKENELIEKLLEKIIEECNNSEPPDNFGGEILNTDSFNFETKDDNIISNEELNVSVTLNFYVLI
jgi:hypothetical protein